MIQFSKYQGTGNDFILIDDRDEVLQKELADPEWVARLCHRRFGIGADGLIALRRAEGYDFEMLYFNSDGYPGSMCGNGGRCAVAFSHQRGIEKSHYHFLAVDGPHEARRLEDGRVALKMSDVGDVEAGDGYFLLDTGSPHYVVFVEDVSDIDVVQTGQAIRYSERFREKGVNVNFVETRARDSIEVATYERGVEDETLSCGTGVTASSLALALKKAEAEHDGRVAIQTKGGELEVTFHKAGESRFTDIWLIGPATWVFGGSLLPDNFLP